MSDEPLEIYDASNPAHVRKARAKQKQQGQLDEAAIRGLLKTADGRRFLAITVAHCRPFQQSFDNSGWTAFNEGVRSVGTTILGLIRKVDEKSFVEIVADVVGRADPPTK